MAAPVPPLTLRWDRSHVRHQAFLSLAATIICFRAWQSAGYVCRRAFSLSFNSQMRSQDKLPYIPSLDGLRGVAVLIVIVAHGVPKTSLSITGAIGVDIFFTLSGFLITSILLSEMERFQSISFTHFYSRRFLRLVPCLWVVVACFLVYYYLFRPSDIFSPRVEAAMALTYTTNWMQAFEWCGSRYLCHTWSLAIEEQFYILWPIVIVMLSRSGLSRLAQGFIVLLAALAVGVYRAAMVGTYSLHRIYEGLDTHCDVILYGAALAYFITLLPKRELCGYAGLAVTYVLTPAAIGGLIFAAQSTPSYNDSFARYGFAACGVCSTVLIVDSVACSHSLIRSVLSFGPIAWVGTISYGLYLWHLPIFVGLRSQGVFEAANWQWGFALGVALTVIVATISFYLLEKPVLGFKRRFERSQSK